MQPHLMNVTYFPVAAEFRHWLEANHDMATELWVGFYKVGSGKPSLTWPQSVDEALCFGWIDGLRKRIDDTRYRIRFTARRPRSVWSAVNIRRVEHLTRLGRMHPAGLRGFEARVENRSGIYAYEQRPAELPDLYAAILKADSQAWDFFQAQPPAYRKTISWWIVSAKTEPTRLNRLQKLIGESAGGRRL
jgi:uncharacterized protein YdeI (YjbR/CyaY-like superfamily)